MTHNVSTADSMSDDKKKRIKTGKKRGLAILFVFIR